MDAVVWTDAKTYDIKKVPIPKPCDNDILVKVACCGVCGSDSKIPELMPPPVITGHETVGPVESMGMNVKGWSKGDRCVIDPVMPCYDCFYCKRARNFTMCEKLGHLGYTVDGGFAEYLVVPSKQVHRIYNLSNEDATLIEPTAAAIHAADRLALEVGSEVLVLGAGPSGLMLSQILKQNGAAFVVLASNKGHKMEFAKANGMADAFVEFERENPETAWQTIRKKYPYGFDAVVEATGSSKATQDALSAVRRGGTLCLYGLYAQHEKVQWEPAKIFGDEIKVIGTFGHAHCFPRAVAYVDGGKIKTKGLVTHRFSLKDYHKVLDTMKSREGVKIVVDVSG